MSTKQERLSVFKETMKAALSHEYPIGRNKERQIDGTEEMMSTTKFYTKRVEIDTSKVTKSHTEQISIRNMDSLEAAKELDITLVPYENQRGMEQTREIIDGIAEKMSQSIGIIVGPEGGFAADEIAMVDELDSMHRISLGRRILRTETAGMATLAMLVYRLD